VKHFHNGTVSDNSAESFDLVRYQTETCMKRQGRDSVVVSNIHREVKVLAYMAQPFATNVLL